MKPSQLLKRYEPRQEAIKRQQDDSERDPTYDHDHSLAHGASKQRTLSVGQFVRFCFGSRFLLLLHHS